MKKTIFIALMFVVALSFACCDKDGPSNEPLDPSAFNPSGEISYDPNLPEAYPPVVTTDKALTLVFHIPEAAQYVLCGSYFKSLAADLQAQDAAFSANGLLPLLKVNSEWYAVIVYPAFEGETLLTTELELNSGTYSGITALPALNVDDVLFYTAIDKNSANVYPSAFKNEFAADANGNLFVNFDAASSRLSEALGKAIYFDGLTLSNNGKATFTANISGTIPDGFEPYFSSADLADYPIEAQKMSKTSDGTFVWTGDFASAGDEPFRWTVVLANEDGEVVKPSGESVVTLTASPLAGLSGDFAF